MVHPDFEHVAMLSDQLQRELQLFRALDGYKHNSLPGSGVQMPIGDPTLNAAAERNTLREQIKAHRQELNEARARCQAKIQRLAVPADRQFLQLRFLFRHTCERCAESIGCSLRHVYRLQNRAVARYSALEVDENETHMDAAQSRADADNGICSRSP